VVGGADKMKTYRIDLSILAPLFFLGFTATVPNHFQSQNMAGLFVVTLFIARDIWEQATWSSALLFIMSTWSALWFSHWPRTDFLHYSQAIQLNMVMTGSQSALFTIGIAVFVLYLMRDELDLWLNGFVFLSLGSALFTIYNFFFSDVAVGILNNCSIDAVFFALTVPLIIKNRKFWVLPFIAVAMIMELYQWHSVTGILMLVSYLFIWLWFSGRWAALGFCAGGILGLAYLRFSTWSSLLGLINGRQEVFQDTVATFKLLHHYVFGNGAGSFISILVPVQAVKHPDTLWLWAHDEVLQIGFELGAVGLLLVLVLYVTMVKRSYKTPWLFMTVVGLGISALSQYPLRLFPTALFSAMACKKCFETKGEINA
jgi:hypothetical protein